MWCARLLSLTKDNRGALPTSIVEIEKRTRDGVQALSIRTAFTEWLASETSVGAGDVIAFNNSFIYRDRVSTTKNDQYLAIQIDESGKVDPASLGIAKPPSFNTDFKRFSVKAGTLPAIVALGDCIRAELLKMGRLIYLLVGFVDDSVGASAPIDHSLFSELRLDPGKADLATVDGAVVVVNAIQDPEAIWEATTRLAREASIIEDELPSNLEAPFATALERLRDEVYSVVRLPSGVLDPEGETLVGRMVDALAKQLVLYDAAIAECADDPMAHPQAYSDVLRIAYNFVSEAGKLIALIVSICDLKPLLLWCTIADHVTLADTFRQLPWTKSRKKASLDRYSETISGARNHAFHDLIPFERSIEVDVSGVSLQATRLRLFSPYAKKSANLLEYEDQELVEVLTAFTRAPETAVPITFWRRNSAVMHALHDLLLSTATALALFSAQLSAKS